MTSFDSTKMTQDLKNTNTKLNGNRQESKGFDLGLKIDGSPCLISLDPKISLAKTQETRPKHKVSDKTKRDRSE